MKNREFIPLNKLLLEDNEEVKKIKTIYKKEEEYADILGPIEYSIADFYSESKKLKDKDVVKAIKNIRLNYYRDLDYFKKPIEKEILISISFALQEKRITRHEFLLVLGYILWCIDNRKWMNNPRAYLDWVLNFFGMMGKDEKEKFEKRFDELGEKFDIDKEKIEIMKGSLKDFEISREDEEWSRKDSKRFAMYDDEKE